MGLSNRELDMIISLAIVLVFILIAVALIDLRFKEIPSIFLTGILFAVMMLQLFQYPASIFPIASGLTMFVFAWLLYEGDFIGGIADVKVITIIGLMLSSYTYIFIAILLILLYGFVYKLLYRYLLKKDKHDEVPFIPCLTSVYIILYLIGGCI